MAQVVSHQFLTMVARVHAQVSPVGFMVDEVATGQFFSEFLGFASFMYHLGDGQWAQYWL
jgi:hypothetical protein